WSGWFAQLAQDRRVTRLEVPSGSSPVTPAEAGVPGPSDSRFCGNDVGAMTLWIAAQRLPQFFAAGPETKLNPAITAPAADAAQDWGREEALVEILRGRLEGLGPTATDDLAAPLGLGPQDIAAGLAALEGEGFALRGRFTGGARAEEWCERRLLARIHRYTVG